MYNVSKSDVERMTNNEIKNMLNEQMDTVVKAINVIDAHKNIDRDLAYRTLDHFEDIEKNLVMLVGLQQLL